MATKKIEISYQEYNSIEELSSDDQVLLKAAINAAKGSYAPYSRFNVGASVRLSNDVILSGANQENAAYPSGLCAERTTIFYAHANYPNEAISSIAVTAINNGEMLPDPTYPCGACRQVLTESEMRAGKPIKVIVGGKNTIHVFSSVRDLMPFAFDNLT